MGNNENASYNHVPNYQVTAVTAVSTLSNSIKSYSDHEVNRQVSYFSKAGFNIIGNMFQKIRWSDVNGQWELVN